jgi:hypothetical protein
MLLGAGTGHIVQLVYSAAAAVDLEVSGSVVVVSSATPPIVDGTNTGPIILASLTNTAGATANIITGIASTKTRVVQLSVRNKDATNANTITVRRTDGTNTTDGVTCSLLAGEVLEYNSAGTWIHYTSDGVIKAQGTIQDLVIAAAASTAHASSAVDTLVVFARKRAGRMNLKYIGPTGVDHVVQDKLSEEGYSLYLPNNGTTVGLNYGLAWTSGGTVSHPTPATTAPAIVNQQKRTRWANVVTTTNQFLGIRTATAEKRYWRGNAAGLGGWNFHARFSVALWPAATVRLFVGLNDSNSGWVISDTLTGNGCGFWHDTTEAATVLTFVTRNGTTATKSSAITLTTALAAGQGFDAYIWAAPNGSEIGYALIDQANGNVLVDTTTTTTIPLNTAFLGQEIAMSNGTANTTVDTTGIALSAHSCQSDN